MSADKSLKNKAIDFKGKKYVLVADRVLFFNENFSKGSIKTEIISPIEAVEIVVKATVWPVAEQALQFFTGHSQATKGDGYINKTSALENAETSAVGRALAMMGIGVIESIASIDEIKKTTYPQYPIKAPVVVEPAWKTLIRKAVNEINPLVENKAQFEMFVKQKTGFDLNEQNSKAILDSLK